MLRRLTVALLLLALPAAAAITRDTGASTFPVTGTRSDCTTGTCPGGALTTSTFSTSQGTAFIFGVGYRDNTNSIFPMSLAWNGGAPSGCTTWTKITGSEQHTPSGELDVAFWYATCGGVVTNASVTLTPTAFDSGANSLAYMIDAIVSADTTTFPTPTFVISSGTTVNKFVTMPTVTTGSWLYWASAADATAAYSTQTNTNKRVENTAGSSGHQTAAGDNITGTSGNIALGWTGTQTWFVGVGIEIKEGTPPPPYTPTFQQGGTRLRLRGTGVRR